VAAEMDGNDDEEEPVYHPDSKWQEPWVDSRLTLYDLHRQPRAVNENPDAQLCLPMKVLNAEFVCPICLGYMDKTSIVMECLHRFCHECIQKCLRLGKKECPSCRIHIPSRRSLRPDPDFDALIRNILGDLNVLAEQERQQAQRAMDRNKAFSASRKRGMLQQANQRSVKKRSSSATSAAAKMPPSEQEVVPKEPNQSETKGNVAPLSPVNMKPSPLVELELRRHPQEHRVDQLAKEWLRLNGDATIRVLKVFLSRKLSHYPPEDFEILSRFERQQHILLGDDNLTLREVRSILSDQDQAMMVLHYRIG